MTASDPFAATRFAQLLERSMRSYCLFGVLVLSAIATSAQANDARRCLDMVAEGRFDEARPVCRNLELSEPNAAMAFGYHQLYGEIGGERLQKIALLGIDKATPDERRTLESARRHFLVAAEAGDPNAQMLLSMMIGVFEPAEISADGVTYNEEQTRWLTKAAEQGVPEANYQLGIRALSPLGTLLIQPEFLPFLIRAAQLGHEEAAERLSEYETATRLASTDSLEDPAALREHAAELWSSPNGDEREANRLMRLLADAGDEEAMVTAGKWSWPEDVEGALKYLTMAAELNNAEAMTALGNFYACRGDSAKAIRWFTEARDRGDSVARYSLNEMRDWGIDEWECRFL